MPRAGRDVAGDVGVERGVLDLVAEVVGVPAAVGALHVRAATRSAARGLVVAAAEVERHRRLDQVPRVGVAAGRPRDVAVGELDATAMASTVAASSRAVMMPGTSARARHRDSRPSRCRRRGSCRAPGSACGRRCPTTAAARTICHTRKSWYLRTGHGVGVVDARPRTSATSTGECSACAWCEPRSDEARAARASPRARAGGRCGCGRRACRGSRWSSAQQTRSGKRVGTVTASRPPGRRTRTSSDDRALVGPDVLEHLRRDDAVEGGVGERQRERVGVHRAARRRPPASSPASTIAPHELPRPRRRSPRVGVERDDGRAAPHRLERVAPAAAAEVEQALARAEVEPIEVDGQHSARCPAAACSASSAR